VVATTASITTIIALREPVTPYQVHPNVLLDLQRELYLLSSGEGIEFDCPDSNLTLYLDATIFNNVSLQAWGNTVGVFNMIYFTDDFFAGCAMPVPHQLWRLLLMVESVAC